MSEQAQLENKPTLRQLIGYDLISLEEAVMVLGWDVTYQNGDVGEVQCCGEAVDTFFDSAHCPKCNRSLFNLAGIVPAGPSSIGTLAHDDDFFDDGVTWYIQYGRGS